MLFLALLKNWHQNNTTPAQLKNQLDSYSNKYATHLDYKLYLSIIKAENHKIAINKSLGISLVIGKDLKLKIVFGFSIGTYAKYFLKTILRYLCTFLKTSNQ